MSYETDPVINANCKKIMAEIRLSKSASSNTGSVQTSQPQDSDQPLAEFLKKYATFEFEKRYGEKAARVMHRLSDLVDAVCRLHEMLNCAEKNPGNPKYASKATVLANQVYFSTKGLLEEASGDWARLQRGVDRIIDDHFPLFAPEHFDCDIKAEYELSKKFLVPRPTPAFTKQNPVSINETDFE